MDAAAFWKKKEAELDSKLVVSSFATYLSGYPGFDKQMPGLFYLMEKGVYFENFDKRTWLDLLGGRLKMDLPEFEKKMLVIPMDSILQVTDLEGNRVKTKKSLLANIGLLFTPLSPGLKICFSGQDGRENPVCFETTEDPFQLIPYFAPYLKRQVH